MNFCTLGVCMAHYILHTQWLAFRTLLLSDDVVLNPVPESFTFCTWNLNSITAHDFYGSVLLKHAIMTLLALLKPTLAPPLMKKKWVYIN